jgi:site-specific recombinase XerD
MREPRKSAAPKHLEIDEIERLFSVITDLRDRAMFRLAYHRGLRASELGVMLLSDYRPHSGRLMVRRLKGSNSGEYLLCRVEESSLRAWIRERGAAAGPMFPSRQRGPITRRRLDQLMKRYCAAAGIPAERAHMHALKHSCGSHLVEQGEDILVIQDHLGHRNVQNTMIYLHTTKKARDSAGERLRDWGKPQGRRRKENANDVESG